MSLFKSKEEIVVAVTQAVPYPQHIEKWDFSVEDSIKFTWRGIGFRIDFVFFM